MHRPTRAVPKGSIALSTVATRVSELEVCCSRCERVWLVDLRLELAEGDRAVSDCWSGLNADCSHAETASVYARCDLHAPGLVDLLRAGGARSIA